MFSPQASALTMSTHETSTLPIFFWVLHSLAKERKGSAIANILSITAVARGNDVNTSISVSSAGIGATMGEA